MQTNKDNTQVGKQSGPIRHTIKITGFKPFSIWNDNGKVRQSGWIALPEVLQDFGNTKNGMFEAGAYMAGMIELSAIMDNRYTNVKTEKI